MVVVVAQMEEQSTFNRLAAGSSPADHKDNQ